MVVVAYRALDERASLNAVYTEIDLASIQLYRSSLVKRRSS